MSERDSDIKYQYREDREVTDEELDAFIKKQRAEQEERINQMLEAAKKERAENVRRRAEMRRAEAALTSETHTTETTANNEKADVGDKTYPFIWNAILCILFYAATVTFAIFAFGISSFWMIIPYLFIGYCVVGLLISFPAVVIENIDDDTIKESIIRRVWITFCLVAFIITAILLSQSVFVSNEEYTENEFYEQPATVCYITDTGDCYHTVYCGYLHSKIKTTVSSAKAQGYRPCSACWSDTTLQERTITNYKTEHNYVLSYLISFAGWMIIWFLVDLIYVKIKKKKTS